MEVEIPFKERFGPRMLSGWKICTSRSMKLGEIGDEFLAFGAKFKIFCVGPMYLRTVAEHLWHEEGCENRREFIDIWCDIHPRAGYVGEKTVYVHFFRRID